MEIAENRLKFSGHHAEIAQSFELGASVAFSGEGEIAQIQQKDNSDGSCIQLHICAYL